MKQLTEDRINEVVLVICSEFKIEKKAVDLYALFEEYDILNNDESYKNLESYLIKKIELLKRIYNTYKIQGVFDKYITGCTKTLKREELFK